MDNALAEDSAGEGRFAPSPDMVGTALTSLMDELAHGVVVATPEGRLLHANHAARHELSRRHALSVQEGYLQAPDIKQSRLLLQALAKAGNGLRSMVTLQIGRASCRERVCT